jgi:hypothetical protein
MIPHDYITESNHHLIGQRPFYPVQLNMSYEIFLHNKPFITHITQEWPLCCVSAYVSSDDPVEQMPYYTLHKRIAALQYVSAYASSDHPVEQKPFYTLHKGMTAIRYVSGYV